MITLNRTENLSNSDQIYAWLAKIRQYVNLGLQIFWSNEKGFDVENGLKSIEAGVKTVQKFMEEMKH